MWGVRARCGAGRTGVSMMASSAASEISSFPSSAQDKQSYKRFGWRGTGDQWRPLEAVEDPCSGMLGDARGWTPPLPEHKVHGLQSGPVTNSFVQATRSDAT